MWLKCDLYTVLERLPFIAKATSNCWFVIGKRRLEGQEKAKSVGGPRKQVWQEGKRFQAKISYWSMGEDCKLLYLKCLTWAEIRTLQKSFKKVGTEEKVLEHFERNNTIELNICLYWPLSASRNYLLWCFIYLDPSMGDFCQLNFPSFTTKRWQ